MAKNIGYLKQCGVFRHMSLAQLDGLERRCRMRNVPRGKLVYSPGDEANAVYLLASGRIKICALTAEGKQAILMFVDPGELFGELAILETGMREEMAEACEDACVIGIPFDGLQQLMEADAETGLAMVRMISAERRGSSPIAFFDTIFSRGNSFYTRSTSCHV
jgi:CRP/FNR family transcriptional regulator, cyclic AMP receptor protein